MHFIYMYLAIWIFGIYFGSVYEETYNKMVNRFLTYISLINVVQMGTNASELVETNLSHIPPVPLVKISTDSLHFELQYK